MKNTMNKIKQLTVLTSALFILSGCGLANGLLSAVFGGDDESAGNGEVTTRNTNTIVSTNSSTELDGSVGVRDVRQINRAFSVATAIPVTNGTIRNVIAQIGTILPSTNDVQEAGAAQLSAITNLASTYCRLMITNDRNRAANDRQAHQDINFNAGLNSFDDDAKASVAQDYAELFWLRAATVEEERIIKETMQEAEDMRGNSSNSRTELEKVLLVGCTMAASSADSIRL